MVWVCEMKKGRRSKGDTWLWNEEVTKAMSRKKIIHKAMYRAGTEHNTNRYKSMNNKAKNGFKGNHRKS